jgi:hypothetical protein
VVNSSQGGGSKDTWVLSPPAHRSSSGRVATEHHEEVVDHGRSQPEVPLTVATVPIAVMPKLAEAQRQQEDQQQQASRWSWPC